MVKLRLVGLRVRHSVVPYDDARRLHEAGLDRVVEAEVGDDPAKECLLGALLARRHEGRGGEVEARQDAARAVDAVEAAHPFRRLLDFVLGETLREALRWHAPGVVRFVVQNEDVPGARHLAEDVPDIGLHAARAALVHTPPLLDPLLGLPGERVPVPHDDRGLA